MSNRYFQTEIGNNAEAIRQIQLRISRVLEDLGYSIRDIFRVRLAVEEALVNAMKHGNHMDSDKSVFVAYTANSERIRIEIEDNGQGFRDLLVPSPLTESNLQKPTGRGIMLMRSFMNSIEYNEVGNRLVMEKLRIA